MGVLRFSFVARARSSISRVAGSDTRCAANLGCRRATRLHIIGMKVMPGVPRGRCMLQIEDGLARARPIAVHELKPRLRLFQAPVAHRPQSLDTLCRARQPAKAPGRRKPPLVSPTKACLHVTRRRP
jgi:hypothetical protein